MCFNHGDLGSSPTIAYGTFWCYIQQRGSNVSSWCESHAGASGWTHVGCRQGFGGVVGSNPTPKKDTEWSGKGGETESQRKTNKQGEPKFTHMKKCIYLL